MSLLSGIKQRVVSGLQTYARQQVEKNNASGIPTYLLTKTKSENNHRHFSLSSLKPSGGGINEVPTQFSGTQIFSILFQNVYQEAKRYRQEQKQQSNTGIETQTQTPPQNSSSIITNKPSISDEQQSGIIGGLSDKKKQID